MRLHSLAPVLLGVLLVCGGAHAAVPGEEFEGRNIDAIGFEGNVLLDDDFLKANTSLRSGMAFSLSAARSDIRGLFAPYTEA